MKKIYIDYDGTLVDFLKPWLSEINRLSKQNEIITENNENEYKETKDKYRYIYNNILFYKKVKGFKGSKNFLKELKSNNYYITIITANTSNAQMKSKNKHIKINYDKLYNEIIYVFESKAQKGGKKYEYTKDGIFIDDNLTYIEGHLKNNNTLAIYYNHNGVVDNKENKEKIKYLKEKYKKFRYTENYKEVLNYIK